MILQALVDYYGRKRAAGAGEIAPTGWEYRDIAFFIELEEDGSAILLDRRDPAYKRGAPLLVPAAEIRSGTDAWKQPNLLWDHVGFVLGWQKLRPDGTPDPADNPDKVTRQAEAFRSRIGALFSRYPESAGLRTILRFYERKSWADVQPVELCDALRAGQGLNVTFKLRDAIDPICHEAWVAQECEPANAADDEGVADAVAQCLVTGQQMPISRLHPKISFVASKPSPLVAANTNEAPAYSSYGKSQALNAPVSKDATSQYALALNSLLRRGSPNKLQIGDATTVIWADRDTSLDADIIAMFGDDPDAGVEHVRQRLNAVNSGKTGHGDAETTFFILGLSPNAARLAVRFWLREPFSRIGPRILCHFADLRIVRQSDKDAVTPSMYWLLRAIAPQGKAENVPPRLAGEWMRAILEGIPYPPALLNAAINRCRAEQSSDSFGGNVPYLRAAILKACINREHRRCNPCLPSDFQFISENLDVNQTDPGYRLGRLFAVLEKIQSDAQGRNINSTIRDRYYGAASSTPAVVFPTLMRLKNAHLRKLSPVQEKYFEKLLGEICGNVEGPLLANFPSHLNLAAQGLFALGYYHQRQSFYTGRDATDATAPNHASEEN